MASTRRQAAVVTALVAVAFGAVALAAGLVDRDPGVPGSRALPQESASVTEPVTANGTATIAASTAPSETPTDGGQPTETPSEAATGLVDTSFRVSTYEVFLARDPFEPVVPEPIAESGDGTASPTTAPTTSPTAAPTTSPTAAPTTSPTASPTGSPSGCQQDATVVCAGRRVSLVDVFTEDGQAGAVVRVDEVLYEVAQGETFAASFQVRSVEPPCVTLLYGDDAFTLCEGESVLK